ncbi:MAG: hypothetical protein JW892_17525 [Anaerolineae bacterium]|nr:hypothetical protein [Anaerolineae bacterium]
MDANEFSKWQQVTKASEKAWVMDSVTKANRGEYLFYLGGQNGLYMRITPDGTGEIGTYEGAIPHIMEATFHVVFSRKVSDSAEATLAHMVGALRLTHLATQLRAIGEIK